MQGSASVIERLKRLLVGELTAADQYFLHSRMYQNWGFHELYERTERERREELAHAERLVARILFLEGVPEVGKRGSLAIGRTVPEMLQNDLGVETAVVDALKEAIAHCEAEQDFESRHLLREMLEDSEDHAHWLEMQLNLIKAMGAENYLQSAAGGLGSGSSKD